MHRWAEAFLGGFQFTKFEVLFWFLEVKGKIWFEKGLTNRCLYDIVKSFLASCKEFNGSNCLAIFGMNCGSFISFLKHHFWTGLSILISLNRNLQWQKTAFQCNHFLPLKYSNQWQQIITFHQQDKKRFGPNPRSIQLLRNQLFCLFVLFPSDKILDTCHHVEKRIEC